MVNLNPVKWHSWHYVAVALELYLYDIGFYKCGNSRCQVRINIQENDTFTSTITDESSKINHHFAVVINASFPFWPANYVRKNIQGKTVDRFRLRWNKNKESDRNFLRDKELKQKILLEHFLRDGHQSFEEDISTCLIDKTDPSDPHKRQYYWMRTLKTIGPFGLNTKETYWTVCTSFSSVLLVYINAESM